jgi:hypothetical protein
MIVGTLGIVSGLVLKMKKNWSDTLKLLSGMGGIIAAATFVFGIIGFSILKSIAASMTTEIPASAAVIIANMNPLVAGLMAGIGAGIAFIISGLIGALIYEGGIWLLHLVGIKVGK